MATYSSNYELAQEISARLGTEPIPFESVLSLCHEIYTELGGDEEQFDNVYEILLEILPLARQTNPIDDSVIALNKTWSSSKINTELSGKQNTLVAGSGITISGDTISAEGKSYNAGTNITIDSANTISAEGYKYYPEIKSFKTIAPMTSTSLINKYSEDGNIIDLPSGKSEGFIFGSRNVLKTMLSTIVGKNNTLDCSVLQPSQPTSNVVVGDKNTVTDGNDATAFGVGNTVTGGVGVYPNNATKGLQFAAGVYLNVTNGFESALGQRNVSHTGDTEAERTRVSLGGGRSNTASVGNNTENKNIIEEMQNGDLYVFGVGGYDGMHIKTETGYENTKTLQEYVTGLETAINSKANAYETATTADIEALFA